MEKLKKISKVVVFVLLFVLIFIKVNSVLTIGQNVTPTVGSYNSFYEEEDNSLEIICLGNSRMTFGWNSVELWEQTGIPSYNLATFSQPALFAKYLMEEADKTQDNLLFIVDINAFRQDQIYGINEGAIRRVTDLFPMSRTKINMIQDALELYPVALDYQIAQNAGDEAKVAELTEEKEGISAGDYYFSFLKYHSRWSEMVKTDFEKVQSNYKTLLESELLFQTIPQKYPIITEEVSSLDENQTKMLDKLIEYVEENDANVLFVSLPAYMQVNTQKQVNQIKAVLESRGQKVLNFNTDKMYTELGIDFATDLSSKDHLNINGSKKLMAYMSEYLLNNYDLTDKRGIEGYESWDQAVIDYSDYVQEMTAPKEETTESE